MFTDEKLTFNRGGLCNSSFKNSCLLGSNHLLKKKAKVFYNQKSNITLNLSTVYTSGDYVGVLPSNPMCVVRIIALYFNTSILKPKCNFICREFLRTYEFLYTKKTFILKINVLLGKIKLNSYLLKNYSFLMLKNVLKVLSCRFSLVKGYFSELKPKLYSIASSPLQKKQIQLMVGIVKYTVSSLTVYGTSSYFLCTSSLKKIKLDFIAFKIHSGFKLPEKTNRGLGSILVATGTGLAPFRAFMYDKFILKMYLKLWVFFGEKNKLNDFFYKKEFCFFLKKKTLNRLDLAFSRDNKNGEGAYVLDIIIRKNYIFWNWFKFNTYVYVCGSLSKVGTGIDLTILKLTQLKFNFYQAVYILKRSKRLGLLKKDVY